MSFTPIDPPSIAVPNEAHAGDTLHAIDGGQPRATAIAWADHHRWFAEEVHPHDSQLKAYLRGAFPVVRDVDDVVQESYLRILRRQAAEPIKSAKAFLFTIARRLAIDWARHEARSPIESVQDLGSLDVYDEGAHVVDAVELNEKIQLLTAAIDALPRRCREVLILRKLQLLSTREVAVRLGISEHAVETQLTRGSARIRAFLHERGIQDVLRRES